MKPLMRHPKLLAAYLLVAVSAMMGVAKADTIYDFNALISTGKNGNPVGPIGFQLTLDDNFTAESFSRQCSQSGCATTGDFSDFTLAFTFNGVGLGLLNNVNDPLFEDTKGTIDGDSGSLTWDTSMNTVSLTFGQGLWNATVFSDAFPDACPAAGCTASGTMTEVPEPASLFVMAVGLAGLAAVSRKRLKGFDTVYRN